MKVPRLSRKGASNDVGKGEDGEEDGHKGGGDHLLANIFLMHIFRCLKIHLFIFFCISFVGDYPVQLIEELQIWLVLEDKTLHVQ